MKNNTESKNESPRLRLTSTAYEREALQLYNADRNRTYPVISTENSGTRSQDVLRALRNEPNRFALWGQVRRLARGIHKPDSNLTSVSISRAFKMLNTPAAKPVRAVPRVAAKGAAA